jgi:hypothetical protein
LISGSDKEPPSALDFIASKSSRADQRCGHRVFRWGRAVLYGFLLLALLLAGLVLSVVETQPDVALTPPAAGSLNEAQSLMSLRLRNHQRKGLLKSIFLTEEDLTAAVQYFLMKQNLAANTRVSLNGSRAECTITIRLPVSFASLFLNINLQAQDELGKANLKALRIGDLSLPPAFARRIFDGITQHTPLADYLVFADQVIKGIRIADNRLEVSLNWSRQTLSQAQALFLDEEAKARLLVYHNELAEILDQAGAQKWISLGSLTQPLFSLALKRSEKSDATQENHALILVLSAYVTGKNLAPLLPKGRRSYPSPRVVLLNRRLDIAQHFMGSAALSITGHRTLADLVGMAKEINDTHSGSGFSFTDLAADRAGAKFGKMAVKTEKTARKLQEIMSQGANESAFMPSIGGLPENLGAAEFSQRFGDINSPAFTAVRNQIDDRIAGCRLYQ